MSHTPSFDEHKPWCGDPSLSRPADECTCHITPEQQIENALHYIQERYVQEPKPTTGKTNFTAMIHRETGGSDPLVQEPGP